MNEAQIHDCCIRRLPAPGTWKCRRARRRGGGDRARVGDRPGANGVPVGRRL